jgi:hypothetical protein
VGCTGDRSKDDQQQREASIRRDEPCKCGCSWQDGRAWFTQARIGKGSASVRTYRHNFGLVPTS